MTAGVFVGPLAVVDILGFKSTIKRNGLEIAIEKSDLLKFRSDEAQKATNRQRFDKDGDHGYDPDITNNLETYTFSDSTLICMPMIRDSTEDILSDMRAIIYAVYHILINCALDKQYLRGAISYGEYFYSPDDNRVFGIPILEAMEYERLQDWVGVGLCPSYMEKFQSLGVQDRRVVEWPVPMKACKGLSLTHALDWVQNFDHIAPQKLEDLLVDCHQGKAANTLAFQATMDRSKSKTPGSGPAQ